MERRNFPKEYMISLLQTTSLSSKEISELTGYSVSTVNRYSKEHRSPIQRYFSAYKSMREVDILPQQMVYLREIEKMTFTEIGRQLRVSEGYARNLYIQYKELLEQEAEWQHAKHQQLQSI